ncbi:hypothetical protein ZIOFF_016076 [Zingiber officinale]|uniref:Myb/SANT-like domain-containing protein n=1 Tax=Zingiber officinale TaxID=94328 RepID=A0A8J5HVF7_ZINOF|nr:hypothetical protein ZIOFF_016076 [Zingiber officinale]
MGCLGALDGTLIKVTPPTEDKPRYRTRKGCISTNVLGVCCPNMQFIYVLPGWEGSAHDGRVLRDAISRPHGLRVPRGCYYLVDSGYCNANGFLVPYRGQQYHLKEFDGHRLETPEEYFNMKHSKARNVIERCFGFFVRMTTITPSIARGRVKNKQYWTDEEVEVLVDALIELASDPLWKVDTGFKNGYMVQIHKMVLGKIPSFNKIVIPHIESKIKYLKTKYNPLSEMCMQSGCQWDDVEHKINCEKMNGVWDFKFPYLRKLDIVWGKDRDTGLSAEDVVDASMDTNWQKNLNVSSSSDNEDESVLDILSQGSPSSSS